MTNIKPKTSIMDILPYLAMSSIPYRDSPYLAEEPTKKKSKRNKHKDKMVKLSRRKNR